MCLIVLKSEQKFLTRFLECFLLVDKATRFLHKVEILDKFKRGSINPVTIGEIPPSGLGGSYY